MLEVTFPDKTVRRKRGKDDFIDAEMAAEAAFTGARTVTPKSRDGMVEALRMLQKTRSTAVAARRVALQMIRADVISAPEELRDQGSVANVGVRLGSRWWPEAAWASRGSPRMPSF